jgi:hypothetical protein
MLMHRRLATAPALLLALALALGCASGAAESRDDAAPQQDAGADRAADVIAQSDGETLDGVAPDDVAAADGAHDTALQSDAAPQSDAGQDAGCPAGHTGVNCEDCISSLYKCDQQCVQSCASCSGKPATCSSPKECMTACTSCTAACVDCQSGYHLCPSGCAADGTDTIATGCRLTCDSQPCAPPAHATAVCTAGACDFTCDAAGHWVRSGSACVCNSSAGFVEQGGACVCDTGTNWKLCGGACVSTTSPATGCAGAPCDACVPPTHATATCDAGGACDFTCDGVGNWEKSGAGCVCKAAYAEVAGSCLPCQYYLGHCYVAVAAAATFDAAEATCVAAGGHLASIADSAENSFVLGVAAADSWIGLKDYATVKQSTSPDYCSSGVWINSAGGTYGGSTTYAYDDYATCSSSSGYDVIFSLDIQAAGVWVFSTSNSSFDTVLGLYSRAGGSGRTGCVGSLLACDDDSGEDYASLIVRNMAIGQYVIIVDGYDYDAYGSYVLDVRRFQWIDGTPHAWANWKNDGSDDEPNNAGGNEYCGVMYKSSGYWNDAECGGSRGYVCERPF